MGLGRSAGALLTGVAWRVSGSERLARSLVATGAGDDEDAAAIAAMALTRGGARAVPIVEDAIAAGETDLVDVLVGIGDERAEESLRALAESEDPEVARAGRSALDELLRIRQHRAA